MNYKFDGQKYITCGVEQRISPMLQMILWQSIEEINVDKDYLQVFKLEKRNINGVDFQYIKHSQEQPEYTSEHTILIENPVDEKIYIIDDVDRVTMLLADEY